MTFKKFGIIKTWSAIILLGWFNFSQAQSPEGVTHSGQHTNQMPFPVDSYHELANPTPTPVKLWNNSQKTIIGWGKTSKRYEKEKPVSKDSLSTDLNLQGWRGEKLSAQWVVSAGKKDLNLSVEISDLKNRNNNQVISKEQIESAFVRYVLTDELNKDQKGACGHRVPANFDSTLVADVIDHKIKEFKVLKRTTRPGWLSIQVPQNTEPGLYSGTLKIKDGSKILKKLIITITVEERLLSAPKEWNFHLDLWQNPYAAARYYKTDLWSDEHFKAMEEDIHHYVNAGGKSITASIIDRPWDGQTQDAFHSMIRWTKKLDGTWDFSFDVFDKWVEFMMDLGVTKQINAYSMIPWKLSFAYFDEATNTTKHLKTKPGEEEYKHSWTAMLKAFAAHLKEKGWFDKTYIAMDERPMESMEAALKVIKNADKNFKISFAGNSHPELFNAIDDYSITLSENYPDKIIESRKKQGKTSTFYTSCSHPYPNSFTFSEPSETEWYGWYAANKKLDGYLRWAYNSWVLEPLLDSRFTTWAAGDTYLIYPGGRTSIRFEKLLAGIQAYEKIQILKSEFKRNNNTEALLQIDKILSSFTIDELNNKSASVMIGKAQKAFKTYKNIAMKILSGFFMNPLTVVTGNFFT